MSKNTDAPDSSTCLRPGTRVAVVVSSYHAELNGEMADSAADTLRDAGLEDANRIDVTAPGAYELPILAQALAVREDVDAVLCFGLVLRGETDHDRYISAAVADALQRVGLNNEKPVLFGLLTCNTLDQAIARARRGEGGHDKGREVARAAIETLAALDRIRSLGEAGR
ncbi:MAG: 6,7-dimethyl-8-ribityllumazine synthase [Planctomycetota bacterium]|jgi:6,7-dimethyl-8-ribityllumazine synthase